MHETKNSRLQRGHHLESPVSAKTQFLFLMAVVFLLSPCSLSPTLMPTVHVAKGEPTGYFLCCCASRALLALAVAWELPPPPRKTNLH